ncbi:PIG-L family deacetylase [Opitutus sp. GAS368]|jgi:LmbE family N-acetylglucosaminyl deacetylase|uniref:PIG-L deacetylase family protein n=1 Tax=Opitutus sp. GAS368 TaxID=1882749 RepID=UPI00087C40B6|nr:PIG-L family deacetylase [Opitutus sp. GAS368]SDR66316.1 N-acetylglucosaminyl deacetylase, LmbE family [Opitutus sp. GAS368]
MRFASPTADAYVPDRRPLAAALARTTHLCLAAHQDDIEILAYHGISAAYARRTFTGVVITDGGGSPRAGKFAKFSDEEMRAVRRVEQRRAARLGHYGAMLQLAHPSAVVKDPRRLEVVADLAAILRATAPDVVYLHNPADKHDTHVACFQRCLEALRSLPARLRPKAVYGCEVWRNLDWLLDTDKVVLDDSARPKLAAQLIAAFASQIAGGKRYDLAIAGRRLANATFHASHATDRATALTWAMDLTPLVQDDKLSVEKYTLGHLDRLRADVAARLRRFK